MDLYVTAGDELPLYRQIIRQITDAIAGSRLSPGDKLPSHRELATQLVIAPLTVKKAYDELEQEGFIETQRGRGTFVRRRLPRERVGESRARLRESAERLLTQAALSGVPYGELLDLLREIRKGTKS
ncbi:MAG: GntR family transcriptional regulator [Acidobacteriota bacterium]|nr:GntR family transcriptional regulator [Acidobacteriota bacterium]MDH3786577.1 GntR family transcriptional regulator [Acidobacteriota bacterium]